jgi:hypothetical protein
VNASAISPYLKDHHSGSVAALELVAHLLKESPTPEDAAILEKLNREIKSEQQVLLQLMEATGTSRNMLNDAGAWVAEKAGQAKLWTSKKESTPLFWLMAFEGLCVAIRGKTSLWRLLTASEFGFNMKAIPADRFAELLAQSEAQEELVEGARLRAGLSLLS